MSDEALARARDLAGRGDLRAAAAAYDRLYGLDPDDPAVAAERAELLDGLAVEEHGIRFRYVPAGDVVMGSADGDPDERPVHHARVGDFWLAETTMSWARFCAIAGWTPPPAGFPAEPDPDDGPGVHPRFFLAQENKIRLQYCEDETLRAVDWHTHAPPPDDPAIAERQVAMFGTPRRRSDNPRAYDGKPMVSVGWTDAAALCQQMSTAEVHYGLPTEAEWERAARGGLVGRRYPWGDADPTPERCDFDRFTEFSIRPVRELPPNGYGLYGMAGSVWEWTADWYDAEFYKASPAVDPTGPDSGEQRVLRGGSWADCADAVTVSFRMACRPGSWTESRWGAHLAPNIGFRVCRRERPAGPERPAG